MNFVKNETLKMRIVSKSKILKCEFLDKLRILAPVCDAMFEAPKKHFCGLDNSEIRIVNVQLLENWGRTKRKKLLQFFL